MAVEATRPRPTLPSSMTATAGIEPWDFYGQIERAGGIVWDEGFDAWLVGSYDLVKEVCRADQDAFELTSLLSDDRPPPMGLTADEWTFFFGFGSRRFIALCGREDHARQHRWWMHAFSPRVLKRWRESMIRPVIHSQIDRFAARGRAELGTEFADGIAPRVIAAAMGLPTEPAFLDRLLELHVTRMELKQHTGQERAAAPVIARALEATEELTALLLPHVEARRDGERDDFISMLWRDAEEVFGDDWDAKDILSAAMGMWEGGGGSTPPSTSNGLYVLLTREGLQEELRRGDERLIRNVVEESLRLFGPVFFRPRIALRDVELSGVQVGKGEQVLTLTVAASRDGGHYPDAGELDLDRTAPRDHFSFFFGPRTCPGHGLARVELEEAFTAVLERLHDLRLDPDAPQPLLSGLMTRRWEPLHVLFRAAS